MQSQVITSTVTGLTSALHTTVRGESVPELVTSLLMPAVRFPSHCYLRDMLAGSVLCIDRDYATKNVLELLTSEALATTFVATLKYTKAHPITFGSKEPEDWQKALSSKGMRELIVFRRLCRSGDQVFAIGYRDIGNKRHGVLLQHSGIDVIRPFSFSLKPRNRVSWRKDVESFTRAPVSIISHWTPAVIAALGIEAIVQHEEPCIILLTYGQSKDHAWCVLRATVITSTVAQLVLSNAIKNHQYVSSLCGQEIFMPAIRVLSEFCNVDRPNERADLWRTSPNQGSMRDNTGVYAHTRVPHNEISVAPLPVLQNVAHFVQGRTCDELKRACSNTDLQAACRRFGLDPTGTKERLAERLVAVDIARTNMAGPSLTRVNGIVPNVISSETGEALRSFDNRLFQKPRKSTSAQESGSINEENLINAIRHVIWPGQTVRTLHGHHCQNMAAIVVRGLVQSKFNTRVLASVDGVVAIHSIQNEGSSTLSYEIAVVECKTRHGKRFVNAEATAGKRGMKRYAFVEIKDGDLHWAIYNARDISARTVTGITMFRRYIPDSEHRSQLLHHMAAYSVDRAPYVVVGPCSLSYVVDVKDTSRLKLRNLLHTVTRSMLMAGLEDLFNPSASLPSEVEENAYFQNTESRELHHGISRSLLILARSKRDPLPEAKYVRPTIVRMCNELGKTGTDTFSRQAVEVFLHRSGTKGGVSKTIHRPISVCVINALYTYRMITTFSRTRKCSNGQVQSIPE